MLSPSLIDAARPLFARLMPPGSRVILATSGGPDSQTLLDLAGHLRHELAWDAVWAVGIDHQLRRDAPRELACAADLAARHGIAFAAISVHVASRGNLLQAARRARYAALARVARDRQATCIALAHTSTDQTETMLQRLCRGSGLRGVAGMRARRGLLVRPLLQVSREAIEAYVLHKQLPHARDPSNTDLRRSRAQLRAQVLPGLRGLNRHAERHFAAFAELAQADDAYLTQQARRRMQRALGPWGSLTVGPLQKAPEVIGKRMVAAWLRHHGVRPSQALLDTLWEARHREALQISRRPIGFFVERGALWCTRLPSPTLAPATLLPIPGKIALPNVGGSLITDEISCISPCLGHFRQSDAESVAFDADRLHFGLKIRPWREGDKLRPFGLNGHSKVSDLFTDAKVPRALRSGWPVVTDGESIVWVVGLRRSGDAPINTETQRIIRLKLNGKLDGALPRSAC